MIKEKHLHRANFKEVCHVLSNLAGSSIEARDLIISQPFFSDLMRVLKVHLIKDDYLDYCWILRIFMRGVQDDHRSYPKLEVATSMLEIISKVFVDTFHPDILMECSSSFLHYLEPNEDQQERNHLFTHMSNLVYHLNRCLYESNLQLKVAKQLLQVLNRLCQGSETTIQELFSNETDLRVKYDN